MNSSTTTPTPVERPVRSTSPALGDIVLVRLDQGIRRPLVVSAVAEVELFDSELDRTAARREVRVSGTLHCEPEDHTTPAFRGTFDQLKDPARIFGRPDRHLPVAYGSALAEGDGIGQWRRR